jgi:acetyl-CoA acetyltransferase
MGQLVPLRCGFTVGITDTIADDATMQAINDTITKAKMDVKEVGLYKLNAVYQ